MSTRINISLSGEQLTALAKLVYMGEWMLNSHRDVPLAEFNDATQIIYAEAKSAGMESLVGFDDLAMEFSPTQEFDAEMYPYIEEYDDDMFWEEFIDRMALRDMLKTYTMEQLATMSIEERMRVRQPFIAHYEDVFDRLGMDCLQIVEGPAPTTIRIN